jgi:hypothetical protein
MLILNSCTGSSSYINSICNSILALEHLAGSTTTFAVSIWHSAYDIPSSYSRLHHQCHFSTFTILSIKTLWCLINQNIELTNQYFVIFSHVICQAWINFRDYRVSVNVLDMIQDVLVFRIVSYSSLTSQKQTLV